MNNERVVLFCNIVQQITGGGEKQNSRADIDASDLLNYNMLRDQLDAVGVVWQYEHLKNLATFLRQS